MHTPTPYPEDRRALRSVALQFWLNGALFSALIPRLPELRDQLGVSIEQLGEAITLAMLGGILGSLTVDRLTQRVDLKRLMIVAAALLIIGLNALVYSPNIWVFAACFAAMAWLDVYVDVAMNIQGSQLSERAPRPVMNRLHGLWSIGTVCGSLSAAAAIALGWTLPQQLWLLTPVFALILVYVTLGLRQPLLQEDETATPVIPTRGANLRKMLVFAVLGAVAIIPEMTSSDWSAFRIHDDLQQSPQWASLGFVVFGTGMMVGRMTGDTVMYHYGQLPTLLAACGLAFVGLVLVAFVDQLPAVFIGLAISGVGTAVFFPTLYDSAAKASRRGGAAMLGAMTVGSRLAALGLPVTVGYLAGWHSVGMAFALLTLPAVVVIAVLGRWVKH